MIMENLLKCNGRKFSAKIRGTYAEGLIRVEDGRVYLCQNMKDGADCGDKLGFSFSWQVNKGSMDDLESTGVTDFRLIHMPAEEIEAYKNWQVGDKITDGLESLEVIFRRGELVVCKDSDDEASINYTCNELHKRGYRLVVESEE
jgi:hypothetical protein|nr:MAG TPA: hypothetical protein [Caudoviricetes sp.]